MCQGLPVKAWSLSAMVSTCTKAPTVTSTTSVRFRCDAKTLFWGGDFQEPLAVWCSLEDISLLSVSFSLSLSSPRIPHKLLTYGCENRSHIHSGKCCPGCLSRFKKITDNKSCSISFVYKLVSPFPIFPDTFYSVIYIPHRSKAF